jgi:phosphatidylethanolamine-binding protein (PEBP) family uncharacterized protein
VAGKQRAVFRVYALEVTLTLTTPTKMKLAAAMRDHILGHAELFAHYE